MLSHRFGIVVLSDGTVGVSRRFVGHVGLASRSIGAIIDDLKTCDRALAFKELLYWC